MTTPDSPFHQGPLATFVESYIDLPSSGPTNWIIDRVVPVGGSVNLFGVAKTGKSMIALQLALAVTNGLADWLSFPVSQCGNVLYFQLDTPRSIWQERCAGWEKEGIYFHHNSLAILDKQSPGLPYPFNILVPSHQEYLRAAVREVNPILTVIDTFRTFFRGDENDPGLIQTVVDTAIGICAPSAVLFISHSKKPPSDPGKEYDLMEEGRGSSALPAAVDTVIRLRMPESGYGNLTMQGRVLDRTNVPVMKGILGTLNVRPV